MELWPLVILVKVGMSLCGGRVRQLVANPWFKRNRTTLNTLKED